MKTGKTSTLPAELRRLQMADVARLAGVSVSTVSRALSGSALISADTCKRVRDLADSLNYSINVGAQNLRLRQNRTVAVVVPFDPKTGQPVADKAAEGMLSTMVDELNARGYSMMLVRIDADRADAITQLHAAGSAVGIVVLGHLPQDEPLNELAARGFPIAVWGARLPQQMYCTVGSDNFAGARAATRHLLLAGCKAIAFFGDVGVPEVAQRYDGYCQALAEGGQTIDPLLCVPGGFRADGARQATMELLRRAVRFDAIFASNDCLAIAAISTLRKLNVRVPEDVAVAGYGDIELASHFHPALTTVRESICAAGRALVDGLVSQIEGKRPLPIVLTTELIVRQSSERSARRVNRGAAAGRA